MTNPRRGAKRPPAAHHAPSYPETALIIDEARAVREMLLRAGIRRPDLDDVMQETIFGAVLAVRRGRYRPNPAIEPGFAVRRWLIGIAFKQLSHLHAKAYRRWELLTDQTVEPADAAPSLEARVIARETLRGLNLLPPWARTVLVLIATGEEVADIAIYVRRPASTVSNRIRLARKRLARNMKRWRR